MNATQKVLHAYNVPNLSKIRLQLKCGHTMVIDYGVAMRHGEQHSVWQRCRICERNLEP